MVPRLALPSSERQRWLLPLALAAVTLAALALRLYALGHRVAYYDEAWFGYWALQYVETGVWEYRPILHGPFLTRVDAVVFPVLGANDFTARLVVALVGVLGLLVVNSAAVAVESSYVRPHESPLGDPGSEVVYYAQAPGSLRTGVDAIAAAAATGVDSAADVADPPPVVIATPDQRAAVARQLGEGYAAREQPLDDVGHRRVVFFVREE